MKIPSVRYKALLETGRISIERHSWLNLLPYVVIFNESSYKKLSDITGIALGWLYFEVTITTKKIYDE